MRIDDEDDGTYHADSYAVNGQKFPVENAGYDDGDDDDADDDEDDDDDDDDNDGVEKAIMDNDEDEEDDDDDEGNGIQRIGKDDYNDCADEGEDEDGDHTDLQKHPKKRKLKTLLPSYEFAPRVPAPPPSASKTSYGGGRNPLTDWTEHETFSLLDSWGERYLKQGKKSLRSEEWQEVAEKVSQVSKLERTDTQCRNRLDTLKKKYKKEKMKPNESEWVYFKKMDTLLSTAPNQTGLSCGVDSGEYVFMNPKVYLNRSNGFDEMRDSPVNSGSAEGGGDESEGLPPKRAKNGRIKNGGASFKILADSFQKFSKIYEKIEDSKRQQMMELEKMRMDFHRDLELQKRQILERAQAEIAKIWQGDDEENTVSAENVSG